MKEGVIGIDVAKDVLSRMDLDMMRGAMRQMPTIGVGN